MDKSNYILNLTTEALKVENIDARKCFLCGREPSSGVGEHVIPKWLQKRHKLSNEQLYRPYFKTRKFSWVMTRKLSETLSRNFVHSCGMV
jgi:hypothetical protein